MLGPLQSVMQDLQSDDNDEDSEDIEDHDMDSDGERPTQTCLPLHHRRLVVNRPYSLWTSAEQCITIVDLSK